MEGPPTPAWVEVVPLQRSPKRKGTKPAQLRIVPAAAPAVSAVPQHMYVLVKGLAGGDRFILNEFEVRVHRSGAVPSGAFLFFGHLEEPVVLADHGGGVFRFSAQECRRDVFSLASVPQRLLCLRVMFEGSCDKFYAPILLVSQKSYFKAFSTLSALPAYPERRLALECYPSKRELLDKLGRALAVDPAQHPLHPDNLRPVAEASRAMGSPIISGASSPAAFDIQQDNNAVGAGAGASKRSKRAGGDADAEQAPAPLSHYPAIVTPPPAAEPALETQLGAGMPIDIDISDAIDVDQDRVVDDEDLELDHRDESLLLLADQAMHMTSELGGDEPPAPKRRVGEWTIRIGGEDGDSE